MSRVRASDRIRASVSPVLLVEKLKCIGIPMAAIENRESQTLAKEKA
jgi:hypothetical protein